MKRVYTVMFLTVYSLFLFGCVNPSNANASNNIVPAVSEYQVGDIVLNDGSYLRDVKKLKTGEKSKAIAVIYKVEGNKAWGVGLVQRNTWTAWCGDYAKAYNKKVEPVQCFVNGDAGNLSFTGDIDGSDNLNQISDFLGLENDTTFEDLYPAFYFALNYKNAPNSHVNGTIYETGWYLPTMSELYDIWKVKLVVDDARNKCGASESQFSAYPRVLSSNQSDSINQVYALNFENGSCIKPGKENSDYYYFSAVTAIRQF